METAINLRSFWKGLCLIRNNRALFFNLRSCSLSGTCENCESFGALNSATIYSIKTWDLKSKVLYPPRTQKPCALKSNELRTEQFSNARPTIAVWLYWLSEAPCSFERFILRNSPELKKNSPQISKGILSQPSGRLWNGFFFFPFFFSQMISTQSTTRCLLFLNKWW